MPADTIVPRDVSLSGEARLGWFDRACRGAVLKALSRISEGSLTLSADGDVYCFGAPGLSMAHVRVRTPCFWRRTALGGVLGAGEGYIQGAWTCDDLTALIRLLLRNEPALRAADAFWSRGLSQLARIGHRLRDNTRRGSRRNIAAHYDLGNDFYQLFLDETMMYSCAIFDPPDQPLAEAQRARLTRIGRKLDLRPDDHLLEIGTGWGGLAIHLARHFGCRVTTTTISRAQHEYAQRMIAQAGLRDRVTVLMQDYRELTGRYDKIVSIEMIEAVGRRWFDTFFSCCQRLLRPDGMMLIQAITIAEPYFERASRTVDFIKKYVFPGSCIPSTGALLRSLRRRTDFYLFDLEEIGPHYAETLRRWRANFQARLDEVRALGYPESFVRLWEFYLSYCEAGFEERSIGNVQMLLTRPGARRAPLARPV